MSSMNREEVSKVLKRTIANVMNTQAGLDIKDRLAQVGLTVKQVVHYYDEQLEIERNKLDDEVTSTMTYKEMQRMLTRLDEEDNEDRDETRYHKPIFKEVGKKLKSSDEEE